MAYIRQDVSKFYARVLRSIIKSPEILTDKNKLKEFMRVYLDTEDNCYAEKLVYTTLFAYICQMPDCAKLQKSNFFATYIDPKYSVTIYSICSSLSLIVGGRPIEILTGQLDISNWPIPKIDPELIDLFNALPQPASRYTFSEFTSAFAENDHYSFYSSTFTPIGIALIPVLMEELRSVVVTFKKRPIAELLLEEDYTLEDLVKAETIYEVLEILPISSFGKYSKTVLSNFLNREDKNVLNQIAIFLRQFEGGIKLSDKVVLSSKNLPVNQPKKKIFAQIKTRVEVGIDEFLTVPEERITVNTEQLARVNWNIIPE